MYDVDRLIGEVAARNGIRIEAGDPAFALVTLNQLMLEEIASRAASHISNRLAGFENTMGSLERRAGTLLAQEIKTAAAEVRAGFQKDMDAASMKTVHLLKLVDEAHKRAARLRSVAFALATAALSAVSFWLGFCFKAH